MDSGQHSIFVTYDPPTHHYRAISTYGQRPHLQYVDEHDSFDDSQQSRIIIKCMTTRSTSPPALFNFVLRSHIIEQRGMFSRPSGLVKSCIICARYVIIVVEHTRNRMWGRDSGNGNSLEKLSMLLEF